MISTSSVRAWSGNATSDGEERADALVHAHLGRLGALGRRGDRVAHLRGGGVEEREDALLLVGEVLVERRLRHPGLAADRLGARLGVARRGRTRRRRPRTGGPSGARGAPRAAARGGRGGWVGRGPTSGTRSVGTGDYSSRRMTRPLAALLAALLPPPPPSGCGAGQPGEPGVLRRRGGRRRGRRGAAEPAAQEEEPTRSARDILVDRAVAPAGRPLLGRSCRPRSTTADIHELSADDVRISGDARPGARRRRHRRRAQEPLELVRQAPGGWRVDRFAGAVR